VCKWYLPLCGKGNVMVFIQERLLPLVAEVYPALPAEIFFLDYLQTKG
jgi:hypothetical protein